MSLSSFPIVVVLVVLIIFLPSLLLKTPTNEGFEIPAVLELPVLPEYESATPVDLINLYKTRTEKLADDLRSLNLPESFLRDPRNYPKIVSGLKRLNLLP